MSHGVHAVQHEVEHQIEHEHAPPHGKKPAENQNRKIALLISVIALLLAISETLGKSAQTVGIELNIKASDTWNFFQAKTIRQTTLRTAAEAMTVGAPATSSEDLAKQIDAWKRTVARYESEPETNEGRKELMARAQAAERDRDVALAKYHQYEFASAAYQIGIVLASSAIITSMLALAYAAGALGIFGIAFTGLGVFAPNVMHDAMHWLEHLFTASGAH